jgi:hypothetical protein
MSGKKNKVRTSITLDPDLLADIRKDAEQSVSAYIETALRSYRKLEQAAAETDSDQQD